DFARYTKVENVIAAGFVDTPGELAALMRGAIAVVMPSLEEGFGLPAAEAMACGVPVLTSMSGARVEVTGDAALHADATSVDALAAAMQRLSEDDALRTTLGARGVARARTLTWRRCAELTREAYFGAVR